MLSPHRAARAVLLAALILPLAATGVTLGQIDNFESGTTQGWIAGGAHPSPPANVATGGPAGAGDNYLRLTALGGSGAGSRLASFNGAQWAGNYTAAGVTGIAMDVLNLGATDLLLRVAIAGPGSNIAISSAAVLLPSGSGWTPILLPVAPADLTALSGTTAGALGNALELRLYHGAATTYPGDVITASLGVDNVRAVPEPSTLGLVSLGALALLRARRPSRR